MKKRINCLLLALALVFSMCACVAGDPSETTVTTEATEGLTAQQEQILLDRRQIVLDEMHNMMSFLWSVDEDITYSITNYSKGIENDDEDDLVTLKAGRIYKGLPYTHGCGTSFDFQAFATEKDEKGVYRISGMTEAALTGEDTFEENIRARVGNDCSEAVFWAWSMVSSSVNFKATNQMTASHGCIQVGEYTCNPVKLAKTKEVTAENGAQTMYEAYAQLQPADALVHNDVATKGGAHAILVDKVVVERNNDGTPDYSRSYAVVTHQTAANLGRGEHYFDQELGEEVYLFGRVEDIFSFEKLFESGYLPMTCKEFINPAPLEEPTVRDSIVNHNIENITQGVFSSAYAVSNVTITVTDENGDQVRKCTAFATESELKAFDLRHFNDIEEVKAGELDLEGLEPGTYRCVHICRLSTGDEIPVRDFAFTVE